MGATSAAGATSATDGASAALTASAGGGLCPTRHRSAEDREAGGASAATAATEAAATGPAGEVVPEPAAAESPAPAGAEVATKTRRRFHGWPSTTATASKLSTITASSSDWWSSVSARATLLPLRVAVSGGADPVPDPWLEDLADPDFVAGGELGEEVELAADELAAEVAEDEPGEPGRYETVETRVPPSPVVLVRPVPSVEEVGAAPLVPQPPAAAVVRSAITEACSRSDSRCVLTWRIRATAVALRAGPSMPARRSSSRSDCGRSELRQPRS